MSRSLRSKGCFAAAALVAGASVSSCVGGQSADGPPSRATSASSSPAVASSAGGTESPTAGSSQSSGPHTSLDEQGAKSALSATLSVVDTSLNDPGSQSDVSDVATGSYLESAIALVAQYEDEDLRQVGNVKIEDVTVVQETADGKILVEACIDSSNVKILDENGKNARGKGNIDRARTIFTLTQLGGEWLIEDESFAEDLAC